MYTLFVTVVVAIVVVVVVVGGRVVGIGIPKTFNLIIDYL